MLVRILADDRICLEEGSITSSVSHTLLGRHGFKRNLSRTINLLALSPQMLEQKNAAIES